MSRSLKACLQAVTLLAALTAGCASTGSSKLQTDMETVEREHAADKLAARGKAFAKLGDYTRAEQYLTAAIREGGDEQAILPLLLRVCVESGRYRVAIDHARAAVRRNPADDRLRYLLATLLSATGNASEAQKELQTVLRRRPDHADAHYALAVLLRDQMASAAAADYHFRQYLKLNPQGPHANEARGSLLKSVP